jgi:hypothetical protein
MSEHSNEAIRQGDAWARARGSELLSCAARSLVAHMFFPQLKEQEAPAQAARYMGEAL